MTGNDAAPSLPTPKIDVDLATMLVNHTKGADALYKLLSDQLIMLNDNYHKTTHSMALNAQPSGYPAYYLGATKAVEGMIAAINETTKGTRT